MTYKSTEQIITDLLQSGDLVRFVPKNRDVDEVEKRVILASRSMSEWLFGDATTRKVKSARRQAQSSLKVFWSGGPVDNQDFMKRLCPHDGEVWEFRGRFDPQIRMFGRFLQRDCFVWLHWAYRKDLGDREDEAWTKAIVKTEGKWESLFGARRAFHSHRFEDFVTFKGEDRAEWNNE